MHSGMRSFAASMLLADLMVASTAHARLVASKRALAVRTTGSAFLALAVTGEDFGAAGPGSQIEIIGKQGGAPVILAIPSTDQRVVVWGDEQVVVKLPSDLDGARATIVTPVDRSRRVRADYYAHDQYDTRAVSGPNDSPAILIVDGAGRAWVNAEFKSNRYFFDPALGALRPALYPQAPPPPPFQQLCNPLTTPITCFPGVDPPSAAAIALDDQGRVWLPEGGWTPAPDVTRNHARVVMYDPAGHVVRLYNLPGDHNGVQGIAWDRVRRRVWVAQTNELRFGTYGNLLKFDPEGVPHEDFTWDFTSPPPSAPSQFTFPATATCNGATPTTFGTCSNAPAQPCADPDDCVRAELFCAPGVTDDSGCYRQYPLGIGQPAHVTVHPDGHVWFAVYGFAFGTQLGRLDPTTGGVELFPLALPPFTPSVPIPFGLVFGLRIAPWDIQVGRDGSIVATEFSANRIAVFAKRSMGSTDCLSLSPPEGESCDAVHEPDGSITLNPRCTNPCIVERLVPGTFEPDASNPPLTYRAVGTLGGFAIDRRRNVWMRYGYMDRRGAFYLMPPLLELYRTPSTPVGDFPTGTFLHDGIGDPSIDDKTGDIWAADYRGHRLNRLRRLH